MNSNFIALLFVCLFFVGSLCLIVDSFLDNDQPD